MDNGLTRKGVRVGENTTCKWESNWDLKFINRKSIQICIGFSLQLKDLKKNYYDYLKNSYIN